jgi:hypothetical protein
MAENNRTTFPRIPESNWWTLRDQFVKTLPKEVSIGYLKSLLQLSTEAAAGNLLRPLKQLRLIDDDGKPTDLANDWRNDTKYAQACEKMLEIYPQELRDLYGNAHADKKAVENWFQHTARLGSGTARQSAALYLLLLDATPKSGVDFAKPKLPVKSDRGKNEKVKPPRPALESPTMPLDAPVQPEPILQSETVSLKNWDDWFSLHVDLQIHISPEASAEQIDQIFASMAKHIMSMKRMKQGTNETN